MDDLEVKLNNLDKLFEEAHQLSEKGTVTLRPENKMGKIQNSWLNKLKPEVVEDKKEYVYIDEFKNNDITPVEEEKVEDIKIDAINYVNDMEEKQEEVTNISEENKVIDFPTSLIPIIETDYPLVVQKETSKALTLTKKTGSILTSILITTVILAIGIVTAIFIRG